MDTPSQAFAVDFGVVGGVGGRELARTASPRVQDYYCWDTPVVAPVAARVVAIMGNLPDNPLGTKDPAHPLGNHVILEDGTRYFYLAHLRRGSVTVSPGAAVAAGAPLGRCGNSGNSDFPHIHVHVTDSPQLGVGLGQPVTYGPMNVTLAGKAFPGVDWPLIRGLWIVAP